MTKETETPVLTGQEAEHRRRSIRLKAYDYIQPGAYFVTICTHERAPLFGQVVDEKVVLNAYGEVV